MFLDGPDAKARDAVHIIFADEKVKPDYVTVSPSLNEVVKAQAAHFKHINLDALVRMKLNSFRDKDRMHLRDMIDVGLIDAGWPAKFPPILGQRLQELLDNPE